jgi:ribonuclease HII
MRQAGTDCRAVVAAAVIFSDDVLIESVFDSKKLSAKKRKELFGEIKHYALAYGIGLSSHGEIDTLNILSATKLAMDRAIAKLKVKPDKIIADGNFYSSDIAPVENIIRGDEKSFSIAAASILAKVTRDEMMINFRRILISALSNTKDTARGHILMRYLNMVILIFTGDRLS